MRLQDCAVAMVALLAIACGPEPYTAPTPWEQGELVSGTVAGSFRTRIGGAQPGWGQFSVGGEEQGDLSRVGVAEVGATWRVVQVQLLERTSEGWRILELDVAEPAWIAGTIPVDGTSAAGTLTQPDGSVQYLIRGEIELTHAGLADGELVAGAMSGIGLVEVP